MSCRVENGNFKVVMLRFEGKIALIFAALIAVRKAMLNMSLLMGVG
jgi:hypothetical protein